MNVLAKLVPVSEIKTIPELSEIFQRQDKVLEDIKNSMQLDGFHKEEPIVIAKLNDGSVLGVAEGNTRLIIAKEIEFNMQKTDSFIAETLHRQKSIIMQTILME